MNAEGVKLVIELQRISKMVMEANRVIKNPRYHEGRCVTCKTPTTHKAFCLKCREYQCDRCGKTKHWAKVATKRCAKCKKMGKFTAEHRI